MLASPTISLPSSAYSTAQGGTASGYVQMNQPFSVGSGEASGGTVADSYSKVLIPAAVAILALVWWLRK